ncbi:hypothetical protein BK119_21290 [Paenibacillus peoriae]|nr:hypothetical protein BK119_21290 [Paenibacillus peoriae]
MNGERDKPASIMSFPCFFISEYILNIIMSLFCSGLTNQNHRTTLKMNGLFIIDRGCLLYRRKKMK